MYRKLIIGLLGVLVFISSCKKEEQVICSEAKVGYSSVKTYGDTANYIRGRIFARTGGDGVCKGYFMEHYLFEDDDFKVYTYFQIIGGLPDTVKYYPDLNNAEWRISIRYLGVGYECVMGIKEPRPGQYPSPEPIEMVEITDIEYIP